MSTEAPAPISSRDRRDASVAAVLARAVRNGEVEAADALRIIKHEMRKRNTNKKLTIAKRSVEAQKVIEKYDSLGQAIPKNDSLEALHADHVHPLTRDQLVAIESVADWVRELHRVREVVCVTAGENYELEKLETSGLTGPGKYEQAGIRWATRPEPAVVIVDDPEPE